MYFASLESAFTWMPVSPDMLYDNDDSTCISLCGYLPTDKHQFSLIIPWDPTQKNSISDAVAVYRCKSGFFVNVTHGIHVIVSVHQGTGTLTESNVIETLLEYVTCPMVTTTNVGLVRSRFYCQCKTVCHIRIKFKLDNSVQPTDDRLCTLRVYD